MELARCRRLLATVRDDSTATTRALLVGGDAGIGKTTLVEAMAAEAVRSGLAVAAGHCVDVSGGMPFGPVLEALSQLALPEKVLPAPEAPNALSLLVAAVAELGHDRPTVLVLEDLHWADRYTTDFARAVVRGGHSRMLLVLTYRVEDVAGAVTFREALVDLRRSPNATELLLGPLSAPSIASLAARRTGRTLDDEATSLLYSRSEGNPLYAEEIMAAEVSGVPPSLADLLTRHVRTLSPKTRAVVRLASVASSLVDVETLRQVAQLDAEAVEDALREALDANVLVRQPRGLAFRHALLRDAIEEDLLPTERSRLHARYVEVLSGRLGSLMSVSERWPIAEDLAFHASAAGDGSTALWAHVEAAVAARGYGARPEAAEHYVAALRMWDDVPAGDRPTTVTKPDLARLAADSYFTLGEPQKVRSYLREALSLLDEDSDRLLASRVHATVASLPHYPADVISDEDAAARAVDLAGSAPSHERVDALLATAYVAERRRHYAAALEGLDETRRALALLAGSTDVSEYRRLESETLWYLGRCQEAIQSFRAAETLSREEGDAGTAIEVAGEVAWLLLMSGRSAECLALARRTRLDAVRAGLPIKEAFAAEQEVFALIFTGHINAARVLFDRLQVAGLFEYKFREMGAELALAEGRIDEALAHDSWTIGTYPDLVYNPIEDIAVRRAAILAAVGDVANETIWARRFIDAVEASDSPLLAAIGAYLGLRLLAERNGAASDRELAARSFRLLERAQAQLSPSWEMTWHAAHLSYAEAYAARLDGRPAVAEWAVGVERAARIGAYVVLQPRLELAAERLRLGDRSTGKEELVAVWQEARAMGAGWYERSAAALATRARVPLPGVGETASPLSRLTVREREVLALLASGATDKDIAESLVISRRTASIHVGNILAKLDVPNRGAAAALARGLG